LACCAALVVAIAVPVLIGILSGGGSEGREKEIYGPLETPPSDAAVPTEAPEEPLWGWDGEMDGASGDFNRWVTVLLDDGLHWMRLNYYLYGVIAGEMPATFPEEALKAQAVAARTYTLYKQSRPTSAHPQAEICGNSACCKAYAAEDALRERWGEDYMTHAKAIRAAVDETDGRIMTYEDEPILAVFHSTSSGITERAADVWGGDLPYLQSVPSTGEEASPRYRAKVELSADECREILLAAYPDMRLSENPKEWFSGVRRSEAGGVTRLRIGGVRVTGGEARRMFGLNSTNFTISATQDGVVFETRGFGHGVGMSQYGARALALEGKGYEEILCWYYTGAVLSVLEETEERSDI
jgi:stage II sporulation protein D